MSEIRQWLSDIRQWLSGIRQWLSDKAAQPRSCKLQGVAALNPDAPPRISPNPTLEPKSVKNARPVERPRGRPRGDGDGRARNVVYTDCAEGHALPARTGESGDLRNVARVYSPGTSAMAVAPRARSWSRWPGVVPLALVQSQGGPARSRCARAAFRRSFALLALFPRLTVCFAAWCFFVGLTCL